SATAVAGASLANEAPHQRSCAGRASEQPQPLGRAQQQPGGEPAAMALAYGRSSAGERSGRLLGPRYGYFASAASSRSIPSPGAVGSAISPPTTRSGFFASSVAYGSQAMGYSMIRKFGMQAAIWRLAAGPTIVLLLPCGATATQ